LGWGEDPSLPKWGLLRVSTERPGTLLGGAGAPGLTDRMLANIAAGWKLYALLLI